jgi:hypothetical protein
MCSAICAERDVASVSPVDGLLPDGAPLIYVISKAILSRISVSQDRKKEKSGSAVYIHVDQ